MRVALRCAVVLVWTALLPSLAFAQASITGTVKDTSGAVLPGVTVEAASPVLIEKVRGAVTDSNGLWKHITSTEPVGEAYSVGATTSAVLDLGGNWWKAGLRNEILEIAIDNGELPTEHEMTVTVEASGTVEVAPTADQVAGLIGDSVKPGDITDVAVSEVTWTKRVEVRKEVLGHCACNHVTVEDLDALTPGSVTSWRVITCA